MTSKDQRRKYIRFNPESMEVAFLGTMAEDFQNYDDETFHFEGEQVGLILDESYKGCNLILIDRDETELPVDSVCILRVGKLSPMRAVVRWREEVTPGVFKVGFEYLE